MIKQYEVFESKNMTAVTVDVYAVSLICISVSFYR